MYSRKCVRQALIIVKIAVIAFVVLAALNASFEAKLYLYRDEPAKAQVASKAIKFTEVRLESAAVAEPVAIVATPTLVVAPVPPAEPAFDLPRRLFLPCALWFRPPPPIA
jgi:hypothetical protein